MSLIYETNNFVVEASPTPHIDREDGGHITIIPKIRVIDRQHLTPTQAIELMRLTIVVGQAMTKVMNHNGVDIGRINYQDNGNWGVLSPEGPYLHVHLYGRAKKAKTHKYGQACYLPSRDTHPEYYKNFKPLSEKDAKEIREEIEELFRQRKFSDNNWKISSH